MKNLRVILLVISFLTITVSGFSQVTADQLYGKLFSKLNGELKPEIGKKLSEEQIETVREEYDKLTEHGVILERFKLGGIDATNATPFIYKDLQNLKKAGEIEKLQGKFSSTMLEIRIMLGTQTKYGADSTQCVQIISTMMEQTKQKNWEAAYKAWTVLFKYYPLSNENVYITGRKIIKNKIKTVHNNAVKEQKAGNKDKMKELLAEKQLWIDTVLQIHDKRMKYFAKNDKKKANILGRKVMDVHKYRGKKQYESVYKLSKEAIELDKNGVSPNVINLFFMYSDKMFGLKKIDAVTVVDNYSVCVDVLSAKIAKLKKRLAKKEDARLRKALEGYQAILKQINATFVEGTYAKCEVLVPAFSKMVEAAPNDTELLKKTAKILSDKECTSSELYEDVVIRLDSIEPSAESAYNLAVYYMRKKPAQYDEGEKYYEKAYTLEQDPEIKAKYYYQAAYVASKKNQYSKARNLAREAIKLKPDYGDAYILIASVYASGKSSCGDAFEQSYVYWVVVDKLIKARNVDVNAAKKANSMISQYSARFPKAGEAFMRGITEGKKMTIGCWINETTTARLIAD